MTCDRFIVNECLWLLSEPTGVAGYDFDFRQFFSCRTPYLSTGQMPGVLRIGAVRNYAECFEQCQADGIDLVNTPEQHERCSFLPLWYPLISSLTPVSRWFSGLPSIEEVEACFAYPVFVKGARQTSKHQAALSVVRSRADLQRVLTAYAHDPILHWQDFVCRELVALRPVLGEAEGAEIVPSFEFRTFWWRGECVGAGRYWTQAAAYDWSSAEKATALAVARTAVQALQCPFVVIDLAQTLAGEWIVIECNDAMESGYAGASPFAIWQAILERESETQGGPVM